MPPEYTLAELAQHTQSTLCGDPEYRILGVEELEVASPTQASFYENARYEKALHSSLAGVVCVHPKMAASLSGRNLLLNPLPSLAFQKILELFMQPSQSGFQGVHPTAVVHPTAFLGEHVQLGPYVVVDQGAFIGAHTHVEAGSFLGAQVRVGEHCHIHPHVVVREGCVIGNRVVLQAGAVIGSSGFGYVTSGRGEHLPLQQLGTVIVEDDVEVGANTTIDRARFKSTRIGKGTKIDNLVQIAHQVELGPHNLIVAQVGIAGSTKTGHHVVMGGQVGVVGHIHIGDEVILAARSAASKSMLEKGVYSGAPAMPIREFNEHFVQVRTLPKWLARIKALEARLAQLEELQTSETPSPTLRTMDALKD